MSSSNNLTLDMTCSGRSFMYAKNSMGSMTDPWGTPDDTGMSSDFTHLEECFETYHPKMILST